jgi:hypothetical protein
LVIGAVTEWTVTAGVDPAAAATGLGAAMATGPDTIIATAVASTINVDLIGTLL